MATGREERELVEGIVADDPAVVREFLERSHDAVYARACQLTADPELRQDWAHDCLLRLLGDVREGRFEYRHPGSLWAWFRKRAGFLLLESRRCHRTRSEREIVTDAGEAFEGPSRWEPDELARLEIRRAVEQCLAALDNDDQRRALRHLLLEDLAYAEIADLMARPLNTVRAWIRRGRLAVRRCLVERLELAR